MKQSPLKRKTPLKAKTVSSQRKPMKRSQRTRTCQRCGAEFYDSQSQRVGRQKFCSQRCFGEDHSERAKASYPPRDEVVRLYEVERLSDRELGARFGHSYQWALKVRQHYGVVGHDLGEHSRKPLRQRRDRARWALHLKPSDVCRNCGRNDGLIHLHHAIPRSMSKAAKYDLRNGVHLCTRCHLGWHHRRVTLYRDIFTKEEWDYISSVRLLGQEIGAWLDDRYPPREEQVEATRLVGLENARRRTAPGEYGRT